MKIILCYVFKSLKKLIFTKKNTHDRNEPMEVDFEHITSEQIIVDFDIKKRDPRIISALARVCNWVCTTQGWKNYKGLPVL